MVPYRVVRRHGSTVLQKSCSAVGACFRTFQSISRVASTDRHGIGQVSGIDHAVSRRVGHLVFRTVGEPVVGGHRGVSARHGLGEVQEVVSRGRAGSTICRCFSVDNSSYEKHFNGSRTLIIFSG